MRDALDLICASAGAPCPQPKAQAGVAPFARGTDCSGTIHAPTRACHVLLRRAARRRLGMRVSILLHKSVNWTTALEVVPPAASAETAARSGNVWALKQALRKLTPVALQPVLQESLEIASGRGRLGAVTLLLTSSWPGSVRIDPSASSGAALVEAPRGGHLDVVEALLAPPVPETVCARTARAPTRLVGVYPGAGDGEALHAAARGGHVAVLKLLWPMARPDERLRSYTLRSAAEGGSVPTLRFLCEDAVTEDQVAAGAGESGCSVPCERMCDAISRAATAGKWVAARYLMKQADVPDGALSQFVQSERELLREHVYESRAVASLTQALEAASLAGEVALVLTLTWMGLRVGNTLLHVTAAAKRRDWDVAFIILRASGKGGPLAVVLREAAKLDDAAAIRRAARVVTHAPLHAHEHTADACREAAEGGCWAALAALVEISLPDVRTTPTVVRDKSVPRGRSEGSERNELTRFLLAACFGHIENLREQVRMGHADAKTGLHVLRSAASSPRRAVKLKRLVDRMLRRRRHPALQLPVRARPAASSKPPVARVKASDLHEGVDEAPPLRKQREYRQWCAWVDSLAAGSVDPAWACCLGDGVA